jgi:hypothetical protein
MTEIPVKHAAQLTVLLAMITLQPNKADAQQLIPLASMPSALSVPGGPVASTPTPLTQLTQKYTHPDLEGPYLGRTSPVATISGVSGSARGSATIFYANERISREVTSNPFQPPDIISSEVPLNLVSPRSEDEWDVSGAGNAALNYDSNIRRSSSQPVGDFYTNVNGGVEARSGTVTDPVEADMAYDYSEDIFARQTQFNTRTHSFSAESRIGRSSFLFQPYFLARFRSVDDQSASESGRQSSDYLLEGVHGEMTPLSGLVYNSDFSYETVNYPASHADNFAEWNVNQELDFQLLNYEKRSYLEKVTVFPWIDLRETAPTEFAAVNQIDGGVGAAVSLLDHLTFHGEVGWGSVSSNDKSINYGSYSGSRYAVSLSYHTEQNLEFGVSYAKVLSFTPLTVGRVTEQAEAFITMPLTLTTHFELIPRLAFYSASSDDYTLDQSNLYGDFELSAIYKFNDHLGLFAKAKYTINSRDTSGTDSEIYDFQSTVGLSFLF